MWPLSIIDNPLGKPSGRTHRQTDLASHDWREALEFVNLDEVLEWSWREEEGLSLLQLHGGGELGLIVIITKVGNLVQGTAGGGG